MPKGSKPAPRQYKPVVQFRSSKTKGEAPTSKIVAKKFHPRDPRFAKQSDGVYREVHANEGKGDGRGRGK